MIYRGPGFRAVVWFGSSPISSLLSCQYAGLATHGGMEGLGVAIRRLEGLGPLINPVLRIRILDPGSGAFLTPGSGIRSLFDPWIRDPEWVFSGSRISDPGSQTHIFESLMTIFWGKKFYKSMKIGPNFFLQRFKNKIINNFVKFVATKKGLTKKIFHPSL